MGILTSRHQGVAVVIHRKTLITPKMKSPWIPRTVKFQVNIWSNIEIKARNQKSQAVAQRLSRLLNVSGTLTFSGNFNKDNPRMVRAVRNRQWHNRNSKKI